MFTIINHDEQSYQPGTLGRCISAMARFYTDKFGVGPRFEYETAADMAAFLGDFDPHRSGFWSLHHEGQVIGCAALDGRSDPTGQTALFRWFYVSASARGLGLGKRLLSLALSHSRKLGQREVRLVTHEDLRAAVHLYEKAGFERSGQINGTLAGIPLRFTHFRHRVPEEHRADPMSTSLLLAVD